MRYNYGVPNEFINFKKPVTRRAFLRYLSLLFLAGGVFPIASEIATAPFREIKALKYYRINQISDLPPEKVQRLKHYIDNAIYILSALNSINFLKMPAKALTANLIAEKPGSCVDLSAEMIALTRGNEISFLRDIGTGLSTHIRGQIVASRTPGVVHDPDNITKKYLIATSQHDPTKIFGSHGVLYGYPSLPRPLGFAAKLAWGAHGVRIGNCDNCCCEEKQEVGSTMLYINPTVGFHDTFDWQPNTVSFPTTLSDQLNPMQRFCMQMAELEAYGIIIPVTTTAEVYVLGNLIIDPLLK